MTDKMTDKQQRFRFMAKHINIKKTLLFGLAGLGLIFIFCIIFIVFIITRVDNKYTGEELFNAVNIHRKDIGVQELQLDINLCDNLVDRWKSIRDGDAHRGFEDWAAKEGLVEGGVAKNFKLLGEMYVTETTPNNAIAWWVGSPGHKLTLEKPELNVGCAYANDGTGVIIVAEK